MTLFASRAFASLGPGVAKAAGDQFFKFAAHFETIHRFSEMRGTAGAIPSLRGCEGATGIASWPVEPQRCSRENPERNAFS
jgi:hypothetical protein